MRFEGVADGEYVAAIVDGPGNRMIVLMPADQAYMTMDLGSAPFSAPAATPMDPANPCGSGEVTECRSLGNETINGRSARGWEYTRDGERETAWIATDLRFPVRTIDADGTTTDFTNVEMGNQPAALFQPPTGWTEMDMTAMLGGFGRGFGDTGTVAGRGQVPAAAAGRGQVPPGGRGRGAGRGAPTGAPAGVDPAAAAQLETQLRAMGLPPDQIAMALSQLSAVAAQQGTDYSAWESGDGWIVDMVVTASHSGTSSSQDATSESFTASFSGSVPITYGTPGAGGMGPAWQLVPGIGSPLGESQRILFAGTSEYRSEYTRAAVCREEADGIRVVAVHRSTGSTDTADGTSKQLLAGARWEVAADLATHTLMAAVTAAEATATVETTTTITSRCPGSEAQGGTERATRQPDMAISMNVSGLPLPSNPGVMNGTATVPMQFDLGGRRVEIEADVEWTLRPIG
jgi:hypothetical protein